MLNEAPKKQKKEKNYANPTKWQFFWRVQKECLRRSVSVFLMYMFMSMIMLATQAFSKEGTTVIEIVLGVLCILGGMFFNGHLCYHCGSDHYDAYLSGCLHRKNALFGIPSGGNHRVEREYRVWKGFLIGFYVGLVVMILGTIAGVFQGTKNVGYAIMFLTMFAGWAIIPVGWVINLVNPNFSYFWSLAFILIPILVSGIFYIVGAMCEKKKTQWQNARQEEAQKAQPKEEHVQTEEQRRKTLQSKKKKR